MYGMGSDIPLILAVGGGSVGGGTTEPPTRGGGGSVGGGGTTEPPTRGGDGGSGGGVVVPPVTPPPVTPPPATPPVTPVTPAPVTPPVDGGGGQNGGVKLNKISNDLLQNLFGTDLAGLFDVDATLADYANLFGDQIKQFLPERSKVDPITALQKAFTKQTAATGLAPQASLNGVANITQNQLGLQNPTQINNLYQGGPGWVQQPAFVDPLAGMSEGDIGMRLQNRLIDPYDYLAHIRASGREPNYSDMAILGDLYAAPPPARSVGGGGGSGFNQGMNIARGAASVFGNFLPPANYAYQPYSYDDPYQAQETVSGRIISGFNGGTSSRGALPGASVSTMVDPFPQTDQEKFFGPNAHRLQQDPEYAKMFAAVTNAPTNYTPDESAPIDWSVFNSYDKAGDTGDQGEQARRIWENWGSATNEEKGRFFMILNNMPLSARAQYQQVFDDRMRAGSREILNNEGFAPQFKSWAADNLANKTYSAYGNVGPGLRIQEPLGDQLGGIFGQAEDLGVDVPDYLKARANSRDRLLGPLGKSIGGWQLQDYGYNSQGMGSGSGADFYASDEGWKDNAAWGNDPHIAFKPADWGNGVGYQQGWHAPTPFKNNSLRGSGGNGITNTGITGRPTAPNVNGPNGGSWSSPREPWNVQPGVNGSPQNASGGQWGSPPAPYQLPPWQNGGGSYGVPHPDAGKPGDPYYNPNSQWYYQPGGPGYVAPDPSAFGGDYGYQGQMIASLYDQNGDMLGTHRPQFYTTPGGNVVRDDAFGGTGRWQPGGQYGPYYSPARYLPFYRYKTNPFSAGQIMGRLS